METTRKKLTCIKIASAFCFSALVLQNCVQHTLFVPSYAEDDSIETLKDEIIDWINTDTKELDAFGVTVYGSLQSAMLNPVFSSVWTAYKTSKFFLDNPSLEAGYDGNITDMTELNPMAGFYADNNGVIHSVMLYDYSNYQIKDYSVKEFPLAESGQFQVRVKVENTDSVNTNPYIVPSSNFPQGSQYFTSAQARTSLIGQCKCTFTVGGYFDVPEYTYTYTGNSSFYPNCIAAIYDSGSLTSVLSSSTVSIYGNNRTIIVGSNPVKLNMDTLPDIALHRAFVPAELSGWLNDEFYPYVVSQTAEGLPLEGFQPSPPPGATPSLPDTGTLDSLIFPPGLPNVTFQDPEIPTDSLPEKAVAGASFWFSTFNNFIDALGVKSYIIIFLIIALILAILKV